MNSDNPGFFDKPKNIQIILRVFYGICALLVALDFFLHRHTYHPLEELFAFYPIYGFVGCVVLVLIAKWMRTFLMRDEDYYDRLQNLRDPSSATEADNTEESH
jgi:hypothetical protein